MSKVKPAGLGGERPPAQNAERHSQDKHHALSLPPATAWAETVVQSARPPRQSVATQKKRRLQQNHYGRTVYLHGCINEKYKRYRIIELRPVEQDRGRVESRSHRCLIHEAPYNSSAQGTASSDCCVPVRLQLVRPLICDGAPRLAPCLA
eukprot:5035869-Pyramimonas_sp.AAC.1